MSILVILILAIGLSMDAFSLALIYGTLNLDKKIEKATSIIVGIFHFIMPILGYRLGKLILSIVKINPDILVGIIFIFLGVEMVISIRKEEQVKLLTNVISIIIFAFTVSIDSFSTGIAFAASKTNIFVPSVVFSLISSLFTYLGIKSGKKLSLLFDNIATLIGALILIALGVKYLM